MPILAAKILVGFMVGVLIGLTGVGGGVLMLPVLIFGLGYSPLVAVGSDALFQFFTKIPAGLLHLRNGTVRRKVVLALAVGSIPGSFAGVKLLIYIRLLYGNGVNTFIKMAVGVLLIVIPTMLLLQKGIEDRIANRTPSMKGFAGMAIIGLTVGFIVGLTSVGSGSIIMMLLLLLYSLPPKMMVGTDIVHAVALTGMTSLLQFHFGNINFPLVGALLIGSIPGGLLGSHLSTRVPVLWLRRLLCAVLMLTGARMLWA
jgi:uncharacterized protein